MILTLDHNQRLNLVAMLDNLENFGRRETWAVCALQEKLDLNDHEREVVGWRRMRAENGREYVVWNREVEAEPKDFELTDDDVKRICGAIDKYPVVLGRDKHWWIPLTTQLLGMEQPEA